MHRALGPEYTFSGGNFEALHSRAPVSTYGKQSAIRDRVEYEVHCIPHRSMQKIDQQGKQYSYIDRSTYICMSLGIFIGIKPLAFAL